MYINCINIFKYINNQQLLLIQYITIFKKYFLNYDYLKLYIYIYL